MKEARELEEYLDLRPRDHQTRWRLAKKYYRLGQYEDAQKHLELLKSEWTPKINVCRYLAATSYRLGDFDKAIGVLSDAITEWPEELPVREQLARVLESAGRRDAAAAIWREIIRLQPSYDSAHDALERLPKSQPSTPLEDRDFGIEKTTGIRCSTCGTWNTDEFERCWKCQAALMAQPEPEAPPSQATSTASQIIAHNDQQRRASLIGVAILIVFWLIGAYLTVRCHAQAGDLDNTAPMAVPARLFDASLLATRMVIGLALLIAFPFSLWLALMAIKYDVTSHSGTFVYSIAMAGLAYSVLWGPLWLIGPFGVALVIASLLAIIVIFKLPVLRAMAVCAIHLGLVGVAALGAFAGAEGLDAVQEFPVLARFVGLHAPVVSKVSLAHVQLPHETTLSWQSTGSKWLDRKVNKIAGEVACEKLTPPLAVEVREGDVTLFYGRMNKTPYAFHQSIVPGQPTKLIFKANAPNEVTVTVYSLLKPGTGS